MANFVTNEGIRMIKHFEGCFLESYVLAADKGEQATIGWGEAIPLSKHPMKITQEEADRRLMNLLALKSAWLNKIIPESASSKLTNSQKAALLSFAYNIKVTRFIGSRSYELLRAGKIKEASVRLKLYNNGGLSGLVRRRNCEYYLLNGGDFARLEKRGFVV